MVQQSYNSLYPRWSRYEGEGALVTASNGAQLFSADAAVRGAGHIQGGAGAQIVAPKTGWKVSEQQMAMNNLPPPPPIIQTPTSMYGAATISAPVQPNYAAGAAAQQAAARINAMLATKSGGSPRAAGGVACSEAALL